MAIQWFETLYESDSKELPWLKDYIRANPNCEPTSHVHEVHVGLRGLLIITGDWKGFLFKGSTGYNHLIEALQHWIQSVEPCPELMAGGSPGGKIRLGIDGTNPIFYWEQIDESYYQKSNGGDASIPAATNGNPLLGAATIPPKQATDTGSNSKRRAAQK